MDPATIIQLTQGSIGLALQCGYAVKALNDIASRYKSAKLAVTSMAQNLDAIDLAWSQIGEWSKKYEVQNSLDGDALLQRLRRSLENGTIIMAALEEDLRPYQADSLDFKQRSKFLWNENILHDHQDRINHLATAMTCLLQAIQLNSSSARTQLLQKVEPVLRRSDESACSIIPSCRSTRMSISTASSSACVETENADITYRRLSCEDDLFTASVYKRNYRNPIINQLFKSRTLSFHEPEVMDELPACVVSSEIVRREELEHTDRLLVRFQEEFADEQTKHIYKPEIKGRIRDQDCKIILRACRDGDLATVESYLNGNRSFSDQPCTHRYLLPEALQDAVANGHHNIVGVLLGLKVPINSNSWWRATNGCGWFPLQYAVNTGDTAMTRLLLEAEADVTSTDSGTPPLHIATHNGDLDITGVLINSGVSIDSRDQSGFQPIHLASAYLNRSDQITFLIKAGANVEAENCLALSWQTRPIQLACFTGHTANVKTLLELGARIDRSCDLNDTPLGIAIRQRHESIVSLLLEHGADPNYGSESGVEDDVGRIGNDTSLPSSRTHR